MLDVSSTSFSFLTNIRYFDQNTSHITLFLSLMNFQVALSDIVVACTPR